MSLLPSVIKDEDLHRLDAVVEERLGDVDLSNLLVMLLNGGPEAALVELGLQFGAVDAVWNAATLDERKALVARVLARRRVRGTRWAVRDALDAIGYPTVHMKKRPTITADGSIVADGTFFANLSLHHFRYWLVLIGGFLVSAELARVLAAFNSWKQKSVLLEDVFFVPSDSDFEDHGLYSNPRDHAWLLTDENGYLVTDEDGYLGTL